MKTKPKYFFSNPDNARTAIRISHRKRLGWKVVFSIKPIIEGKKHRAYAICEGKEYEFFGKSNIEARDKLFAKLNSIKI